MKRIFALLALGQFCAVMAFAGQPLGLASALRARALLGAEVWSQVIRIENQGSTAHYPRTVHALVFELVGILWFYTDCEGTQIFSTHRGHLEGDKADFAPLLREINRGFGPWTVVETGLAADAMGRGPLLNGCFVESVAILRQRLITGGAVGHPRILCYSAKIKGRRSGHAVLTFETDAGVEVIDPTQSSNPQLFPLKLARNGQALATELIGQLVDKVMWVPVSDFAAALVGRYTQATQTYATATH